MAQRAPVPVTPRGPRRATEDRLDAHHQLGRGEGLGEVVVGALVNAGDAVVGRAQRGEHENRDVAALAKPAEHAEAVELGEHHVEHDELRGIGLDLRQRGATVARLDHREALALEVGADQRDDLGVVVDDKHGCG